MIKVPNIVLCPICGNRKQKQRNGATEVSKHYLSVLKSRPCRSCAMKKHAKRKHGLYGTKLYSVWYGMRQRCGYVKGCDKTTLKYYEGKGIKICRKWLDVKNFVLWALKNGYEEGLVIDRKDNTKGYSPSNCRWITWTESARNTSHVKLNPEKVKRIRKLRDTGMSWGQLEKMFNVSKGCVQGVCNRINWKDVT